MKLLVFFILFLFSLKAVSQEKTLELDPDGTTWLSEEDVSKDTSTIMEVKPEKIISCEKEGTERLYFIFKPGIMDNTNLCEMYLFFTVNIKPKKHADWFAENNESFCEQHLIHLIDRIDGLNDKGFTCFERN